MKCPFDREKTCDSLCPLFSNLDDECSILVGMLALRQILDMMVAREKK